DLLGNLSGIDLTERTANGTKLLAVLRTKERQVRLHFVIQHTTKICEGTDVLHVELVEDLVLEPHNRFGIGRVRCVHQDRWQWLADLDVCLGTSRAPELDHRKYRRHLP